MLPLFFYRFLIILQGKKQLSFKHSSLKRPLNASIKTYLLAYRDV